MTGEQLDAGAAVTRLVLGTFGLVVTVVLVWPLLRDWWRKR